MTERFSISQSTIRVWMTCPLQAKFAKIDKLPRKQNAAASFGSCIHNALDLYNNGLSIDEAVDIFLDTWENPEKLNVTPDVWPKMSTFGGYRSRGIETLRNYHANLQWDSRDVLATEHEFLVPFGDRFLLHGFVDLLERRKNSKGHEILKVVDYKTNKRQPNFVQLQLDIQFTTYVFAAQQREFWVGNDYAKPMLNGEFLYEMNKDLPVRAIWYHLENNKEYDAGPREEPDFRRLYRACVEIEKAIKHDVYVPNISGESCLYCDYKEPCGVEIPTAAELEEDEGRW